MSKKYYANLDMNKWPIQYKELLFIIIII